MGKLSKNFKDAYKEHGKSVSVKPLIIAVSAIAFIALVYVLLTAFQMPSAPRQFVENHTVAYEESIFFTYEINRYSTKVEISNLTGSNLSIGFSLEPWNLNFGMVPTGGNAGKRFMTLKNTADDEAKIILVAYGSISSLVSFSDNNFILPSGAVKQVDIVLETKKDTSLGNYSGEIDLIVKRPKFSLVRRLL